MDFNMKKLISIFLCIVLSLSLFGCNVQFDRLLGNATTHTRDEDSGASSAPATGSPVVTQTAGTAETEAAETDATETGAALASASEKPSDSQSSAKPEPAQSSVPQPSSEDHPTPTPAPAEQPREDEDAALWKSAGLPFAFTAKDIYGNEVTEKSLGEKQLFFIHYWATWCGPCLQEMPDLAQTAIDFCDSVGFIALLDDYDSNLSGAQRIVESAGIPQSFIMVDAASREVSELTRLVLSGYLPTTAIIDSDGNLAAEQLVGAYGEVYALVLEYLLANGPG